MGRYRLTRTAQADIVEILAWSHEQFGEQARKRYQALIAAAIRDVGALTDDLGQTARPELGAGIFSWHLTRSRSHTRGGKVRRPRHFLICRRDGDVLVIGRVLHDAMGLRRHIDPCQPWG